MKMTKFNLGALPSLPDDRDYSVCAIPRTYPEKFRLAMDKNYAQEYGTCVAQSARGVFRERFNIEFGTAFLYGGGSALLLRAPAPPSALWTCRAVPPSTAAAAAAPAPRLGLRSASAFNR